MEYPGILQKLQQHMEFSWVNLKRFGFFCGGQEKKI